MWCLLNVFSANLTTQLQPPYQFSKDRLKGVSRKSPKKGFNRLKKFVHAAKRIPEKFSFIAPKRKKSHDAQSGLSAG
jgi:hypothetical protein